jgi:large subunit ribosomal protein L32
MAVPKRRTSRAKRDKRRAHDSMTTPARSSCPQCGEPKLPHRVCANCGTYRGREVIRTDDED